MWCCFHWVVMEFMWHSFPPSASCPLLLSLAALFMFAHLLFSMIISHPGKFMLEVREKAPSLTGRWWFWLQLRFLMIKNSTLLDMTDNIIWFCSALLIIKFPSDCTTRLHTAETSLSACHQSCLASSYRQQRTLEFAPQGYNEWPRRKKTTYN